ncbi:head GIN domain-containing protein [Fulvivirga sp.]|uniref:head GIN domain-containing protein n=1 Tax=Fulvivirga sp. TaxID=1931237 RepID=UPI0032EB3BE1
MTLLFFGCNDADAPDCLKSSGKGVTKVIEVGDFDALLINNEFNVILTEGPARDVKLTIGENLFNDIDFTLSGSLLEITNQVSCKWTRDYNYPLLEITHPNISFIEIIGGSIIRSNGTLTYPNLSLKSKASNGIIELSLNSASLSIDSNEITNYLLSGSVDELYVLFSSGDGRFEGANLQCTNARIIQNSSNDIIVNVTNQLTGELNSTGDLIFVGQVPNGISIEEKDRGRLINGVN